MEDGPILDSAAGVWSQFASIVSEMRLWRLSAKIPSFTSSDCPTWRSCSCYRLFLMDMFRCAVVVVGLQPYGRLNERRVALYRGLIHHPHPLGLLKGYSSKLKGSLPILSAARPAQKRPLDQSPKPFSPLYCCQLSDSDSRISLRCSVITVSVFWAGK